MRIDVVGADDSGLGSFFSCHYGIPGQRIEIRSPG
jgi:hypothetical protein